MPSFTQRWQAAFQKRLAVSQFTSADQQDLAQLFLALLDALDDVEPGASAPVAETLAARLFSHHNMLALLRQQMGELEAIKRITQNLTGNLQLQAVLDAIVAEAMHLVQDAQDAHIYLYQDGQLLFGAALDCGGKRNQEFRTPRPNGLTASVAHSGEMIVVNTPQIHPLFQEVLEENTHPIMGLPLKQGDTVIGVMNMARQNNRPFRLSEQRLLQLLANQAAVAILNARMHEALAMQALSDTLTGLPNRRALDRRLENEVVRAERYGRSFGVLMMDLDGFKAINDTWGHAIGDQVLHQVARFLSGGARASDFLARYGGDELTMILPESSANLAQQTAQNIQHRFQTFGFTLPDGSNTRIGLSGGLAMYPTHARTASDLLRAADEALYRAKRYARGTIVVARGFTGELRTPNIKP